MSVVTLVVVLALAPLVPGVSVRVKSLLTGRRGAPMLQLYRDIAKLVRKGVVYGAPTTIAFRLAPVASVTTAVVAACLVPLDGQQALLAFSGDVIAFAYVLALGRFLVVLGALDTASSFEGMGASREVTIATFAELTLFLGIVALAVASGQDSLTGMFGTSLAPLRAGRTAALVMVAFTLFAVLVAEASRGPVDDPATHLELTMIHEVMILDHSGPDLALLLYGNAVKFALFAALIAVTVVGPADLSVAWSITVLVVGLVAVAAAVGVIEGTMARLRLAHVPQFLIAAGVLAAVAAVLLMY